MNRLGFLGERHIYPDYLLLRENARKNRFSMTDAEIALWNLLKNKQTGEKFRRQHIIGDYIVDFICLEKHLIIEVDGGYHFLEKQQKEDLNRTQYLTSLGYRVIRFTNKQIFEDIDQVIQQIKTKL